MLIRLTVGRTERSKCLVARKLLNETSQHNDWKFVSWQISVLSIFMFISFPPRNDATTTDLQQVKGIKLILSLVDSIRDVALGTEEFKPDTNRSLRFLQGHFKCLIFWWWIWWIQSDKSQHNLPVSFIWLV